MTLEQLRMLVNIVEHGSILSAAKAMYRSQPTISVAMKKLEEEYEVQVFNRDNFRIGLTPAGEALYKQAQTILTHVTHFEVLGKQLGQGIEPEVCISYVAFAQIGPILSILKKYQSLYPQTKFTLTTEYLGGATERLLEGEADLAIVAKYEDNPKLTAEFLTDVGFTAVCAPDFVDQHHLKKRDLENCTQIVLRDNSQRSELKSVGLIANAPQWFVTDHFTKKQIILSGMGWGRLPDHMITQELENGSLVPLIAQDYETSLRAEVQLARRVDQPLGKIASEIWQDLLVVAPEW
ncbi:LysR family transcriptional regulator [Vibrio profundum]|uniref:LysR family transcriptional regulator n=1 Tax=Vibrio profundum TaxID=2910247 RepID=UPI003D0D5EFD